MKYDPAACRCTHGSDCPEHRSADQHHDPAGHVTGDDHWAPGSYTPGSAIEEPGDPAWSPLRSYNTFDED